MDSLKSLVRHCLPERLEIHVQALDHYIRGERELRLMHQVCDRSRPTIDIGANIGTYTYFLRRHSAKVYAYEPNPGLAERLIRIFPDVDVRAKAVSDIPGRLELRIPVKNGRDQHELGSIVQDFEDFDEMRHHEVAVVAIDDEGIDEVGFIKVDVEQNEIAVLTGALATIERCRPVVMTEVSPLLYDKGLPETFSFLIDRGYVGWFKFRGAWLPFSRFVSSEHAHPDLFGSAQFMDNNVFFVPSERDGAALLRG